MSVKKQTHLILNSFTVKSFRETIECSYQKAKHEGINDSGEKTLKTQLLLSTSDLQVVVFWLPVPHAEPHKSGLSLHFQVHTSALKG